MGMKETENVPFDSMPPLIRGLFLTKEQEKKLKEPFKDVVSVVRYKDCKFRGSKICPFYQKYQGEKYDDWFCADGEQKG